MKDHYKNNICYSNIGCFVNKYISGLSGIKILDVGSKDINGSYRDYFNGPGWEYVGMDIVPGKNVDVVSTEPYNWPFEDEEFDCLVSGQVLEHVEYPWKTMGEAARVMKKGAFIFISAPAVFKIHKFPIDAWRFFPDGISALFKWAGLKEIEVF